MLSYQITGFQICVPMTDEQWSKLEAMDADGSSGYIFIQALEAVGAQRVDWNGHFGQYLFFNAEADFDTDEYGRSVVNQVIAKIEELL